MGQGVDGENLDDEEGESGFEEHDMGCREEEQITMAPGLKFGEVGEKNLGELHSGLRKLGSAPQPLFIFLYGKPSISEFRPTAYGRPQMRRAPGRIP